MSCPECKTDKLKVYHVTFECINGHKYTELVAPAEDPKPEEPRQAPRMTFGRRGHEKILDGGEQPPEQLKMPFGKYKGTYIEDLDTDYILWCLGNLERLDERIKTEMENQITMRGGKGVRR